MLLWSVIALGQQGIPSLDTGVKGSRPPSFSTDTGAANAYVLTTIDHTIFPGLKTGSVFYFFAAHANTGASTANVDGTGVKNITKNGATALSGGEINANGATFLMYDGTEYQIVSGASSSSGGSGCPLSNGVNAQTANYTLLTGDAGKLVVFNGSTLTATLPASPPTATWCATIENINSSSVTVSRNSLTINGGTSNITLAQYQVTTIFTDGTNYYATRPLAAGTGISLTESPNQESIASTISGTVIPYYDVCMMGFGANNASSALANADLSPQISNRCYVPAGATVVEVMVSADAGTPSVQLAKNHLGTQSNLLTGSLSTASSGNKACSNTTGTTSLDGTTVCSSTLTVTSIAAGDYLEPSGGTAGGTAKAFSAAIVYKYTGTLIYTCMFGFGANNASAALGNADISPQVSQRCYLPAGSTIVEVMVTADAGTPSVLPAKNHLGSDTNLLSSALATAASGGRACSNSAGTTSLDGSTVCSSTLTTTSILSGDYLEPNGGTAGGTAKAFSVAISYTSP